MAILPQLYRSTLRQFVTNVRPSLALSSSSPPHPPDPPAPPSPPCLRHHRPTQSIHPRTARSPSIPKHLRALFESGRAIEAGGERARKFEKDVENLVVFLRARRIHKVRRRASLSARSTAQPPWTTARAIAPDR